MSTRASPHYTDPHPRPGVPALLHELRARGEDFADLEEFLAAEFAEPWYEDD